MNWTESGMAGLRHNKSDQGRWPASAVPGFPSRRWIRTMCSGLLALVWSGGWFPALAAVDWPVLSFVQATTNSLSQPTSITHAGDGSQRVFITERLGRIRILQGSNVLAQPFLDLTNKVLTTGSEQGLLSVAFPPGFSSKGYFYVNYTRKPDGAVTIARFQLTDDNNLADTNSEQVILTIPKVYNYHNGGQIAFGPDGYLYIGVGDGGPQGDTQLNGQRTTTLYGKILRLDVESGVNPYVIPPSNPFVGNTNYMPHIWAYGVRNPWRFSFDRVTGDFYLGDVGQYRWEEIDFVAAGSPGGNNFGWRIREGATNYVVPAGFTNFASLTEPVTTYDHWTLPTDAAGSVTGGYVYRGPSEPRMDGVYLYGDFMCGWIWGLKREGTNWQNAPLLQPGFTPSHYWISTFGEDETGRLYLADYNVGKIYRIEDSHQVWTPVFTPTNGIINSNIVMVTCNTPDVAIHYTTNGVDPSLSDPFVLSGQTLVVGAGLTNKARAFRNDLSPSGVVSAVYNFKVGTPVFNPPASAITNRTPISISTVTPGATIYYTTNGTTPTTNSGVYLGPVVVSGGVTLRALGVAGGYSNSAIASASYSTILAATPTFNPPSGLLSNATSVTISCATPDAVIRYTLDDTTPTANSPMYAAPVVITNPATLKAVAFRDDLGASTVGSIYYGFISYDRTVVTTLAGSPMSGFSNALGGLARFSSPQAIALYGQTNLLIGDRANHVIRSVQFSGVVQTFAGSGESGNANGTFTQAQFGDPAGVCCDGSGNVYVADGGCGAWLVRKLDPSKNVTTIYFQPNVCNAIGQLEADGGDSIFAGYAGNLYQISATGVTNRVVATLNGTPYGYVGVGIDSATNVFGINVVQLWKYDPQGVLTLFAGDPNGTVGFSDGPRLLARFSAAQDVALDVASNIFVSDGARVRRIGSDGTVHTVAGNGVAGYKNGRGAVAQFRNATGLCVDTNQNIFVTDTDNHCIRKISPDTANIGIADDWQRLHFGAVGIDPNADPDHDGMSNYAEFWAGTNPTNAASALIIDTSTLWNSNQIQIRWPTVPGKTYTVQYSSDLVGWATLGSNVIGDGTMATVIDPASLQQTGKRYYRILLAEY